jgi:hypothetical protein
MSQGKEKGWSRGNSFNLFFALPCLGHSTGAKDTSALMCQLTAAP